MLLFCCLWARAQDYEISIKSWDANDGLSDREVIGLYKDSRGLIWLCTKNGLNCFDGYGFKSYSKEKDSLPFRHLCRVTEDATGDLWVLGSANIDTNNLFIFNPLSKKVRSFYEKTGYKQKFGFDFVHRIDDSLLFFGKNNDTCFFTWHPRRGLKQMRYPVSVRFLVTVTDHNTFWVLNDSGELAEVTMDGTVAARYKTDHQIVGDVLGIANDMVYKSKPGRLNTSKLVVEVAIENNKGVIRELYSVFSRTQFNTGLDSIKYINGVLIHPTKGILKDFVKDYDKKLAINGRSILIESPGRFWMGNTYGLHLITVKKSTFRKYFYQDINTFAKNSYRNLLVDNGRLYALNEANGVTQFALDSSKRKLQPAVLPDMLNNINLKKTTDGRIIGINRFYFFWKPMSTDLWRYLDLPRVHDWTHVWKIYQAGPDSFMLGTARGLWSVNTKTLSFSPFTSYNQFTELKNTIILEILPDRNNKIWICSNTGFYVLDPVRGITERYSAADTGSHYLPAKEFQHFYQDAEGVYWLATTSGLIKWDKANGTSRLFNRQDGLSNENIYAVYPDSMNRLWLSSDYGIMEFNKTSYKVKTYLTGDGITYNEFNRVSHTSDENSNIYFGTLNGVTGFNPRDFPVVTNEQKPDNLVVTLFEQFNGQTNRLEDMTSSIIKTRQIVLNPSDRFFNISFALLTYDDIIHTVYYWKVEGVDSGWNSMKETVLRMGGLPYGKWLLRIKAQARDGSWSNNELQFPVLVLKPFYLRPWFLLLSGIGLILAIAGWFRWRVLRLRRENERLDSIVKEKTIALEGTISDLQLSFKQKDILMKEIHHRVKNNLQVIGTLLNLQMSKIQDEVARVSIEEGISRISSIALIHHHLYKGEHLTNIELSVFTRELVDQVSAVYKHEDQVVSLENKIPETPLDIDTAIPLGLILNELLTNSFKYAFKNERTCKLKIEITRQNSQYTLKYYDHGPGLPQGYIIETAGSLGMVLIKSLARQLAGDFSYDLASNCFIVHFIDGEARKKIE